MKKRNLLSQVYRLTKDSCPRTSHTRTNTRATEKLVQEAPQYSAQLPVSIPKSQKDFWDQLAEQKRKEVGIIDTEVIGSE